MITTDITIRTARLADAEAIGGITSLYAEKGYILKRAPKNII